MNPGQSFLPGPTPDTVRAADGKNVFCRVVQGEQSVPAGATYFDALQVQ